MAASLGPLLVESLTRELEFSIEEELERVARDRIVLIAGPKVDPRSSASWGEYRERVGEAMAPVRRELEDLGIVSELLVSANVLRASLTSEQIFRIRDWPGIELLELDPWIRCGALDDVAGDLEVDDFRVRHPHLDGSGVRVAVLDGGIDTAHPHLQVESSMDLTGEGLGIPGLHATHCAGMIASQHPVFRGVAPGVTLLNIKVTRADQFALGSDISCGIDKAQELGAQVLSLSLGMNHLPVTVPGLREAHGWHCPGGHCFLCSAVDVAVQFDTVVVAAAGNEHLIAEQLRAQTAQGPSSEIRCPGQSRGAITVGALTKSPFTAGQSSSHGPTADGRSKPDLSAPGVDILSTIPVPRNANGEPLANPPEELLFGLSTGSSMATALVAGVAALLVQRRRADGEPVSGTAEAVRETLLAQGVRTLDLPSLVAGAGCLDLSGL